MFKVALSAEFYGIGSVHTTSQLPITCISFLILLKKQTRSLNCGLILLFSVARPGFEPRQTEPKSVVLPLYYRAMPFEQSGCKNNHSFQQYKSFRDVFFELPLLFFQLSSISIPKTQVYQDFQMFSTLFFAIVN